MVGQGCATNLCTVKFAVDSLLEVAGFELSVPQKTSSVPGRLRFPFAADYFSLPGIRQRRLQGMLPSPRALRGVEPFGPSVSGRRRVVRSDLVKFPQRKGIKGTFRMDSMPRAQRR